MASGKLLIRMKAELHSALQSDAVRNRQSLNDLCCERLVIPNFLNHLPVEVESALIATQRATGAMLVGVVLFGSWARGSQSDRSDIDLLIVLEPNQPINRAVYRRWQEAASDLDQCEPHFVSLPADLDHVSGLWAEIALDGVMLIDPTCRIQRYLAQVRRALVDGRLINKKAHGQSYWIRREAG